MIRVLFLLLLAISSASATNFVIDCTLAQPCRTASGQALDGSFIFEAGSFAAGFTPTAANTAQWAANWSAAGRAGWDPQYRYFSAAFALTANLPPFTSGANVWFWGMSGDQWILLRKPDWKWPGLSTVPGPPIIWSADSTATAALGTVNSGGFFLTTATAAGPLPSLTWAQWQAIYWSGASLTNPAVSGPAADPDGDGRTNFDEYAGGSHPAVAASAAAPVLCPALVSGNMTVAIRRNPRAVLAISAEHTSDLTTWSTATLLTNPDGSFADSAPFSRRSFLRFQIALP